MGNLDAATETMNIAIFWRGMFIQRYSEIEFALADLLARARHHEAYNTLGDLPRFHAGKLKRLEEVVLSQGPLAAYGEKLLGMIAKFQDLEETRHFLAHGIMLVRRNADDPRQLCLSMYRHQDGALHQGLFYLTLDELIAVSQSLAPTSLGFTELVGRIIREVPLPQLVAPDKRASAPD